MRFRASNGLQMHERMGTAVVMVHLSICTISISATEQGRRLINSELTENGVGLIMR